MILLIGIMAALCLTVEFAAIGMLYSTAMGEERERLVETVQSQARLIEAIARFDSKHSTGFPQGARKATLSQITDAHSRYQGFGETGEFTLSRLQDGMMIFLLSHRHSDHLEPNPIPLDSHLAEPMRRALDGKSGTVIGLDYRGERVLAAYEPVRELDLGIVAKIDLSEIRAPFKRAAVVSGVVSLVAILIGSVLFLRITEPLVSALSRTVKDLQRALKEVKQLGGMLPICAYCKKIRDDKGYWNQIESYIRTHTETEFSHGICPDCLTTQHPELKTIENGGPINTRWEEGPEPAPEVEAPA